MTNYRKSISLCPLCGTSVSSNASTCPGCGHKLHATDRCPMCGTMLEPDADYCSACGAALVNVLTNEKLNISQNQEQPISQPEGNTQITIDDLLQDSELQNLINQIKEQPSSTREKQFGELSAQKQSTANGSRYRFSASRISGDGNAVFPDELIIDNEFVIFRKGRLLGYQETKIRHHAVGSVHLDKHLLFADIIIETRGGRTVVAKGFTRSDADEIVGLIG